MLFKPSRTTASSLSVWNILFAFSHGPPRSAIQQRARGSTSVPTPSGLIKRYALFLIFPAIFYRNGLHHEPPPHQNLPFVFLAGLFSLAGWIVRIVARFTLRGAIPNSTATSPEPMGLYLNPFMHFFFGNLYFTYHINRLIEIKRAMHYRNAAINSL